MRRKSIVFVAVLVVLQLEFSSAQPLVPPPLPDVPPIISETYSNDLDGDRIDDGLQYVANGASAMYLFALTQAEKEDAQTILGDMIDVELIFNKPITQEQIDDFQLLGGEVAYIFKAVSYGWNGRIPLQQVDILPALMGPTLVLVEQPKTIRPCMDLATQTGRVRPIWKSGFAGNVDGYDGDPSITIAILDSGVDETHMDLSGRRVYWRDFSNDNEPNPVDHGSHGSHIAGIAVGTGAAGGKDPGTLYYTYTDPYSYELHYPSNIGLRSYCTFSSEASWSGTTQATLSIFGQRKGDLNDLKLVQSNFVDFRSPIELTCDIFPEAEYVYFPFVMTLNEGEEIGNVVIKNSVTNYPGVGDDFNKFSGVAPACSWAGAKIENNEGEGSTGYLTAAIDDLVSERRTKKIMIMNISHGVVEANGLPKESTSLRNKVNSAVKSGVVFVVAAGNEADIVDLSVGEAARKMGDPARAALAITVGASNDENELTDYSTYGFTNPQRWGSEEDYKPDLIAPGGSSHYTGIISVDSGTSDCYGRSDKQSNDYELKEGTSFSAPFVAGCVALVIDAMQQEGITWNFNSDEHPRYVKMVLCATGTETNADRENDPNLPPYDPNDPTLQRAENGPNGFPKGKDHHEGYGIINPDAAIEAVTLTYSIGTTVSEDLESSVSGKRAWARTVRLSAGARFSIELINPTGGDFDLYLYSATPTATGTPLILESSTSGSKGTNERIEYTSDTSTDALLVVKRVSGSGRFELRSTAAGGGASGLNVLICGANHNPGLEDIRQKLLGTGKFDTVSILNVNNDTPYLTDLQAYDAVQVHSNFYYEDTTVLGNVMSDYIDSGGGVVCMMFEVAESSNNRMMQGRWNSQQYYAIPRGSVKYGPRATLGTVYDSGHTIMQGISVFDGGPQSYRPQTFDVMPGAVRVADWSDGRPLVVTKTIGSARRVDLAFYPLSSDVADNFWDSSTDGALLMANALTWVARSATDTLMPLPEFSETFSDSTLTRGYWFEAPTNFRITRLRVPDESGNGRQNVEVVRFDDQIPPGNHPATTNAFMSLTRFVDEPSGNILSVNIPVSTGDIIGILGAAGTSTMHNSYGPGDFISNIDGHSVTLKRMGMQYNLYENHARDLWQEPGDNIGRIEMWYIAD